MKYEFPSKFEIRCGGINQKTKEYLVLYYNIASQSANDFNQSKNKIINLFKTFNNCDSVKIDIKNKGSF